MAGAYAHLTIVNKACTENELEELGLSNDSLIALEEYTTFIELGSVSPDYPYLAFTEKHKKWADSMHLDMKTKSFILKGIEEVKAIEDEEDKRKAFAWLCGLAGHIVTDVVIHPVVELKVGPYEGHESAHRNCEMHQDVYIYKKITGYGDISETEQLSLFGKECSHNGDTDKLNKVISSVWGKMLEELNNEEYLTNKPEFDTWHSRFHTLVSTVEETQNFPTISRHVIGLDGGIIYPKSEEVNIEEYIENLEVPGNKTMHYDDIFNKAVSQVQQTWKVLDEAVYGNGNSHLEYFADWNLDNGKTSSDKLEYWA
ncbi:MAG: zinc dependent phospholipase C family protein [Halarcobacter sp.]